MSKFADVALSPPLQQALASLRYETATPVQAQTLPIMLQGRDVLAQAKTGSGKTAAFGLALLQSLDSGITQLQGLILCPTRELADQVAKELRALARFVPNIKILSLCGGVSVRPQLASLAHEPHIVVGTPGRIQDLLKRDVLPLKGLSTVVLDEADRMLDMGFIDPIRSILEKTPTTRRTWLFSATYPDEIRQISHAVQRDPVVISIADQHNDASIAQRFFKAEKNAKLDTLRALLIERSPESCLVYQQ